jgi:hypothetical protein
MKDAACCINFSCAVMCLFPLRPVDLQIQGWEVRMYEILMIPSWSEFGTAIHRICLMLLVRKCFTQKGLMPAGPSLPFFIPVFSLPLQSIAKQDQNYERFRRS